MDCEHLWLDCVWPWLSAFLQSPGFAGVAAVIAAAIAFFGVRHTARLNAWWQRAEWALDLLTRENVDDEQYVTALAALRVLQGSRLAKREEQRFLREIVDATTLDPLGDGAETDDEPGDDHQAPDTEPIPTVRQGIRGILVEKLTRFRRGRAR